MQNKIFYSSTVFLLALALIFGAYHSASAAAFNDVVFSDNAVIHIDSLGIDLTVVSVRNVAGVSVAADSVSFDMMNGSSITVRSYGMNQLGNDIGTFTCYPGLSEVTLSSTQTETLTLTPTSATCTAPSSGGGGGGGGGGGYVAPAPVTAAATSSITSQAAATVTTPAVPTATSQISVPAATGGSSGGLRFSVRLKVGAENSDVKQLQGILVREGVYPEGIVSGYFGSLTQKAVQSFQEKYGIAKSGEVGYGEVGPNTRAKLNQLISGSAAGTSAPASAPVQELSIAVKAQIQLLQNQLTKLLAALAQALQFQVQELQGH